MGDRCAERPGTGMLLWQHEFYFVLERDGRPPPKPYIYQAIEFRKGFDLPEIEKENGEESEQRRNPRAGEIERADDHGEAGDQVIERCCGVRHRAFGVVFEIVGAEHGARLVRDDGGALQPAVAIAISKDDQHAVVGPRDEDVAAVPRHRG